jgi:hypothetical protein
MFEIVAYIGAGTVNPVSAFSEGDTITTVVLSVCAVIVALGLISLLGLQVQAWEGLTDDTICWNDDCSAVDRNIRAWEAVLGVARKCERCGRWFHGKCYKGHSCTAQPSRPPWGDLLD